MRTVFGTPFMHRLVLALSSLALAVTLAAPLISQAAQKSGAAAMDAQVLSGGVGEGERKQLAEQARDHNLKLVLTMATGNYLAGVPFQIERAGKVVVEDTSKGPWVFAKLPAGNYTVKATYEGKTVTRQVSVPKSGQKTVSLTWPATQRVAEQPQGR
jgi:hypothetical protein